MKLRNIIRTISASLTTAIIVSCTINGEPEGRQVTDYQEAGRSRIIRNMK